MLHMRRATPVRIITAIGPFVTGLWDRVVASDPGLLRLIMAARGTSAVFLTTLVALAAGHVLDAQPVEFASGVVFSLIATFLMREPTRRRRERTLVVLALPTAFAAVATTLLHGHGPVGDCFFLVLVFFCFLLQARDPRGLGIGLVAVVTSYIGLYLELPPATLPVQLLAIVLAIPVTWFASFALFPLRPAATLRRTVQAVQGRAATVLRDAGGLAAQNPATVKRLRRSLAQLTEAALAADDQLALLHPVGSGPLRLHLMDLELAAAKLANAPLVTACSQAGGSQAGMPKAAHRHSAHLRVHERRLRQGRWSARHMRPGTGQPRSAIAAALADIARAASALGLAAAALPAITPPPPATRPPPGPLAWRVASRVTLASAMAMTGGMLLSPQRWFWAVITTYVVFLNARSRGDTIFRGIERLGGTVLGLMAGLALAAVLEGHVAAQAIALLLAIFGMYYIFLVSYTLAIFCVTVLLGLLYSMLGASIAPLLVLRLEETTVGAVSAILVAAFVFPVRTREQVGRSGVGVLRALANAVEACQRSLEGQAGANTVAAMRAVDRQVADLRLALLPLTVGRIMLRRSAIERPVPALLDCVHWARMLTVAAATPDPDAAIPAGQIAQRLAAMAAGEPVAPASPPRQAAVLAPALLALDRLEQATATLAERLAISALQGFRLER
jgi:uncharacterized membrane protein YccC